MNTTDKASWKDIWEKKGHVSLERIELKELIAIDGFDTGAGQFPIQSWLSFVEAIRARLDIREGYSVLEVGCGAGAFLLPLANEGINVYGIDYTGSLVGLCEQAIPVGVFCVSEANRIPFESGMFDVVVSNSVFQYFCGLEYAQTVLQEISRVLKENGKAALLDINDADMKDEYESIRRTRLGNEEYERLYSSIQHQFYSRSWFEDQAERIGFSCSIQEQDIQGYENSAFRYNVFLEKE